MYVSMHRRYAGGGAGGRDAHSGFDWRGAFPIARAAPPICGAFLGVPLPFPAPSFRIVTCMGTPAAPFLPRLAARGLGVATVS